MADDLDGRNGLVAAPEDARGLMGNVCSQQDRLSDTKVNIKVQSIDVRDFVLGARNRST